MDSPNQKLITMRHFRSKAQDFAAKLFELNEATQGGFRSDVDLVSALKAEYSREIWHDFFSWLSSKAQDFYESSYFLYKDLFSRILTDPVTIQVSPYRRCIETIALILSDCSPSLAMDIKNSRCEHYEFEIDGVPITLKVNDLLSERSMGNIILPELLLPQEDTREGYDQLTLPQKQRLRYYEKINGGESMVDVMVRCKLMLQEFIQSGENQVWISHNLFLNQLINTVKGSSYFGYADEDNKNLPNGYINVFDLQQGEVVPQIIGHTLKATVPVVEIREVSVNGVAAV